MWESVAIRLASMGPLWPGLIGGLQIESNQQCCEWDMSSHGQPSEGVWEKTVVGEIRRRLKIETAVFWVICRSWREGFSCQEVAFSKLGGN